MTGCLAPCHRWEYELIDGMDPPDHRPSLDPYTMEMSLVVKIPNGRFLEYQQYVVYTVGDLLADIGGYLGLLLGHRVAIQ